MSKVKFSIRNKSCFSINILIKKGVTVAKPRFYKDRLEFFVRLKEQYLCQKILEEYNIEYKVLSKRGAFVFMQRNLNRAGLIVGFVAAVIMLFVYSNCIFNLNIEGLEEVDKEIVLETAYEHIKPPSVFKKVDIKKLEEDIIKIEGIANAAVEKGGTTINITILEELPLPNIEDIKDELKDITSKYDSVITRITVTGGTPLVKKGQAVKKGQKLIGAYIYSDENTTVYTKAGGQVYGKVLLTKSKTIYPQKLVYVRTGKIYSEYNIPFFNWINKKKKVPFSHYETKTEKVVLGGGMKFEAEKITYFETVPKKIDIDVLKEAEVEIIELFDRLEEEMDEDMKRVRKWFDIKRLDKSVKIDIYYEVEMLIGEQ